MALGVVGRKCGMTRVFTEDGKSIPVTVVEALPNRIVQLKNIEKDGYCALQVTRGEAKVSRLTKPLVQHYAKAGVGAGEGLWEIRADDAKEIENYKIGDSLTVDQLFKEGDLVDVSGVSKGKGYAGVMKRHNFGGGPASHGCSVSHRMPGSIGQRQTPGRVFKGKKMAGHLGDHRCTVQSQRVVRVDSDRNLILVKGGIPGAPGGLVVVKPAVKAGKRGE